MTEPTAIDWLSQIDSANLPHKTVLIEVPFHDCDAMEVVWHGHYSKYLEVARCALLDDMQFNYPEMRAAGFIWPLVDLQIKYVRSCVFRQQLAVTVRIAEFEHRLRMHYVISDARTGERLTRATTTQVAIDLATREMQLVSPPSLLEHIAGWQRAHPVSV